MNLRDRQRQFLLAVTRGEGFPDDAMAAGLRVHANNVRGQLLFALRDTHEKTRLWLGDDAFDRHASTYVEAYLPDSWTLDDYGNDFPAHLAQACPEMPEVTELAWIDAALRRAFSGADATALSAATLVVDDWDEATFTFVPTLCMRTVATNAPAIWAALADGSPAHVRPALSGSGVLAWRHALTPRFRTMSREECGCLDLALAGGTFAEVCTWLAGSVGAEETAAMAGSLLRTWLDDGLLLAMG